MKGRTKKPRQKKSRMHARINPDRRRLHKAMSIVACCRLAAGSLYEHGDDTEIIVVALEAAYDLIGETAEQLDEFI
jgi:hypothetical protein